MRSYLGRAGFVIAGLFLVAGCTSGGADDPEAAVTTGAPATTSTEASATTETTLSDFQISEAAIAEAQAEIESTVIAWYTFPRDTSLGEAGMSLELLTGALYDRNVELTETRTAAGEIQRSRGGARIGILEVRVDLVAGLADIDVCSLGDAELVDAETGELLDADDGDSWNSQVQARLIDGVWLLEDFASGEANGGTECVFSE